MAGGREDGQASWLFLMSRDREYLKLPRKYVRARCCKEFSLKETRIHLKETLRCAATFLKSVVVSITLREISWKQVDA